MKEVNKRAKEEGQGKRKNGKRTQSKLKKENATKILVLFVLKKKMIQVPQKHRENVK